MNMIAVMMPLRYTPTRCSTLGVSNRTMTTSTPHPIAIGAIRGKVRRRLREGPTGAVIF